MIKRYKLKVDSIAKILLNSRHASLYKNLKPKTAKNDVMETWEWISKRFYIRVLFLY